VLYSTETQWDLRDIERETPDTLIQLFKQYDEAGTLLSETLIFEGFSAITEEYNTEGLAIKQYTWIYEGSFTDLPQTDTVYLFYTETNNTDNIKPAFTSTYAGTVIKDSTTFDSAGRQVEKWEYKEGLLWRYSIVEYAETSGISIIRKIYNTFDEAGNLTEAEWLNGDYDITHTQMGDSTLVECLEPLSRWECITKLM